MARSICWWGGLVLSVQRAVLGAHPGHLRRLDVGPVRHLAAAGEAGGLAGVQPPAGVEEAGPGEAVRGEAGAGQLGPVRQEGESSLVRPPHVRVSMAGAVERRERQGPVEPSCQGRDQEQWHDERQPDSEQSVGLVSEDTVDTVDQPVMN